MMSWNPRCYIPSFVVIGSGEEDFRRVFTIYGRGGHLGHVTQMPRTIFRSSYPKRHHIKFGFDLPSGFRDVLVLRSNDGRTPEHGYFIGSPISLRLRQAKYLVENGPVVSEKSKF